MKYADDYHRGDVFALGCHRVSAEEIIDFAGRYDPQPYHLSHEAGSQSFFGGLAASGWHTASIWMGLYVRAMLQGAQVEGSPGVDELRWLAPVRPGDCLVGEVEVIDLVPSSFRKELVTIKKRGRLFREGETKPLMTLVLNSCFLRRNAGAQEKTDVGREGKMQAVSLTAQWTAAIRALESEQTGSALFRDDLARRLAQPDGFELLNRYKGAGVCEFVVIRTRYFDDASCAVLAMAPHIRQVVMVAAGMDTRAYRLPWPNDTRVFEIDHGDLLAEKAEHLVRVGLPSQVQRIEVAADLAVGWTQQLVDAGFNPQQPTLWLVEGLLFFLTEDQVRDVLSKCANLSAVGSRLVVDMTSEALLKSPFSQFFLSTLRNDGVPWLFGTDEPECFLSELGWAANDVREPGTVEIGSDRWPYKTLSREVAGVARSWLIMATIAR